MRGEGTKSIGQSQTLHLSWGSICKIQRCAVGASGKDRQQRLSLCPLGKEILGNSTTQLADTAAMHAACLDQDVAPVYPVPYSRLELAKRSVAWPCHSTLNKTSSIRLSAWEICSIRLTLHHIITCIISKYLCPLPPVKPCNTAPIYSLLST